MSCETKKNYIIKSYKKLYILYIIIKKLFNIIY